jgi:uncharacterized protein YdeI (YjbR/CyaY-like superfamily)
MANNTEPQIMLFASSLAWEQWLSEFSPMQQGIWVQIAKKASGIITVTYDEALEVALCYGWIDGQRKSHNEDHFLQKFTPRRPKSLWSKRNVAKIAQLIDSARMQPAGLAEVEAAQQDGRWQAAYASQKDMVIPEDFLFAVQQNKKAAAFYSTLNKTNLYAIAWRLQTAKNPETRARRFGVLLEMLEKRTTLL